MSETLERRLNKVYKSLRSGAGPLTSTELIWLQRAMLDGALMHRKSSNGPLASLAALDNAPVDDVRT